MNIESGCLHLKKKYLLILNSQPENLHSFNVITALHFPTLCSKLQQPFTNPLEEGQGEAERKLRTRLIFSLIFTATKTWELAICTLSLLKPATLYNCNWIETHAHANTNAQMQKCLIHIFIAAAMRCQATKFPLHHELAHMLMGAKLQQMSSSWYFLWHSSALLSSNWQEFITTLSHWIEWERMGANESEWWL